MVAIQIDGRDDEEDFRIFIVGERVREVYDGGVQLVMRGEAFVNGLIELRSEVRARLFTRNRGDRASS